MANFYNLLEKNYNSICYNIFKNGPDKNLYNSQIKYFSKIFNNIVFAFEKKEQMLSTENHHDLWLNFLDILYKYNRNIHMNKSLLDKNNTNKYANEFGDFISDKKKKLLVIMSNYFGINRILDIICDKNKNAEIGEYKSYLLEMIAFLKEYIFLIYQSKICVYSNNKIISKEGKGMNINLNVCNICKRNFEDQEKEKIIIFYCGHIIHKYCCFNREIGCPICFNKDMDISIIKMEYNIIQENRNKKDNDKIKKNALLNKLKKYDYNYLKNNREILVYSLLQ